MMTSVLPRFSRFLRKSPCEKAALIKNRWKRFLAACDEFFLSIPVPIRLPFGAWWVKRKDSLSGPLLSGSFESAELVFVERFLQPGMTVLDIGAHNGLYSLLASKRVGPSGRVFAFEPSPRERRALRLNLAINFCGNVAVQEFAVGSQEATADLFVVQGTQTGCNSLRPPGVFSSTKPVRVRVTTLDQWLLRKRIPHVDFIKIDVEGAELDVLKGAEAVLQSHPRPIILAEVQDVRTQPWGYKSKEILTLLGTAGFTWLRLAANGLVQELDTSPDFFEGNFLACPSESLHVLRKMANQ